MLWMHRNVLSNIMGGVRACALQVAHRPACLCTISNQSPDKKSIVFLGTPSVAADVLEDLLNAAQTENYFKIAAIVTQPPSQRGRGRKQLPSAVAQCAMDKGFPTTCIYYPERAGEEVFLSELKKLKADLCVTAAYGNILPSKFLSIPSCGTVNLHPSLLPLYRGAAPVQRALQDGVKVSGVSIAYTVRALDAGPIIAAESTAVDTSIKAPELLKLLFKKGTELLLRNLPSILDGSAKLTAREQDHALASVACKVTVDESWLDFELPAELLHNKVRAFADWPGTKGRFQLRQAHGQLVNLDLKIVTTRVMYTSNSHTDDHTVQLKGDALAVHCGGNSTLEILELQSPGKRVMLAREYWNGLKGQQMLRFSGTDIIKKILV